MLADGRRRIYRMRFVGDIGGLWTEQNIGPEAMSRAELMALNLDIQPID
jgi:hypothetical protein